MAEHVLIIGMNNPLSSRPDLALWPAPERCTGWRVWRMLTNHSEAHGYGPILRRQYTQAFDRVNLVVGEDWSIRRAREGWTRLRMERSDLSAYAAVLLLGAEVQRVVLDRIEYPILGQASNPKFWCIPHPSGLNRLYNDPEVRETAAEILHRLYLRATA